MGSYKKMLVYQDVFTNQEVLSDSFTPIFEEDNVIVKVHSRYTNKDNAGDVDIGCGNAFGGGEEEQGGDEPEEKVNNIEYNFGLVETPFSKKDLLSYMKVYLKKKSYLEENGKADRVEAFQARSQAFIKRVIGDLENWTFYLPSNESMDGGLVFSCGEDEAAPGPVFYYFF